MADSGFAAVQGRMLENLRRAEAAEKELAKLREAGPIVVADADRWFAKARDLSARVEELEAERQAVIDCLNLYGDATVHNALDGAGLLRDTDTPKEQTGA